MGLRNTVLVVSEKEYTSNYNVGDTHELRYFWLLMKTTTKSQKVVVA